MQHHTRGSAHCPSVCALRVSVVVIDQYTGWCSRQYSSQPTSSCRRASSASACCCCCCCPACPASLCARASDALTPRSVRPTPIAAAAAAAAGMTGIPAPAACCEAACVDAAYAHKAAAVELGWEGPKASSKAGSRPHTPCTSSDEAAWRVRVCVRACVCA
eukprot:1159814-Pelagomonas_calceolata.AAC.7